MDDDELLGDDSRWWVCSFSIPLIGGSRRKPEPFCCEKSDIREDGSICSGREALTMSMEATTEGIDMVKESADAISEENMDMEGDMCGWWDEEMPASGRLLFIEDENAETSADWNC